MRTWTFMAGVCAGVCIITAAAAEPAGVPPDMAAAPGPPAGAGNAPAEARQATPPAEDERTANNAVWIEGLGPALFYSINYDRSFGDFSVRVGFSYLSVSGTTSSGTSQETVSASFVSIPVTLNYLGVGTKRNMLELGAGATLLHVGEGASVFDTDSSSTATGSATVVFPHAVVGYRFQPPAGGFVFRAGLTLLFAGSEIPVLPWPYVAFGGAF